MADDRVLMDVGVLQRLRALVESAGGIASPKMREEMLQAINAACDTGNPPEKRGEPTDEQFVAAAQEKIYGLSASQKSWLGIEVPDAPLLEIKDRKKGARVQAWLLVTVADVENL